MLWNVVFEFFVKYIFGGYLNDGGDYYIASMGSHILNDGGEYSLEDGTTGTIFVPQIFKYYWGGGVDDVYLPLGNYLSLIATIITMVVILVLCCLLIKKIYNICARVIA